MKFPNILLVAFVSVFALHAKAVNIESGDSRAVVVTPEASSGLEAVYVVRNTDNVRLSRETSDPASTKWFRFSRLGGAYAEEISFETNGNTTWIPVGQEDMGYMVETGGRQICVWVINYANHELQFDSLTLAPEQDCDRTLLNFSGNAEELSYYTINGRRLGISRELTVEYSNLTFNEENFSFVPSVTTETIDGINSTLSIEAPLVDTRFTLTGDRFTRAWGYQESIESPVYQTQRVEVHTRTTQENVDIDNEIKDGNSDNLGGSAPAEIEFEAVVSDATIFTEWQISRTPDFDILDNSFNELAFNYTFRDNGTTYVRFIGNNAGGTCETASDTYQIFIGESRLEIPNAFSPQGSPGVNDEWKVSYRSLVSYKCSIFNRSGKELFSSTDPAQGWDGKTGGKYVPAGVYFYVIEAVGSDGIKYKRAGDINIINYKQGNSVPQE